MAQSTFSAQTVGQDIKDFNTLDPQKKMMVAAIVLILFVGSIFVGAYLSRGGNMDTNKENTTNENTTAPTKKPSTTLKITSDTSMKVGETKTVTVELSNIPVTAADVIVTYDPEVLTVSDIQNGEVFAKVIQRKIDIAKGMLTYSGSVDPSNPNDLKTGKVMTFKVKAIKEAKATLLQFGKDDTITAINGENTLGLTTGASIKVTK